MVLIVLFDEEEEEAKEFGEVLESCSCLILTHVLHFPRIRRDPCAVGQAPCPKIRRGIIMFRPALCYGPTFGEFGASPHSNPTKSTIHSNSISTSYLLFICFHSILSLRNIFFYLIATEAISRLVSSADAPAASGNSGINYIWTCIQVRASTGILTQHETAWKSGLCHVGISCLLHYSVSHCLTKPKIL
jgi:hypothetical protein